SEVIAKIVANGGKAFAIDAFLGPAGTAEALAERFVGEIQERLGEAAIDILVNNFGAGGAGNFSDTTNELFDEAVNKGVRVPYFLVKSFVPFMRSGGSVINVSSVA